MITPGYFSLGDDERLPSVIADLDGQVREAFVIEQAIQPRAHFAARGMHGRGRTDSSGSLPDAGS
ncbi:hypothetical protein BOX37_13925 [Nocardia mangyaensis]|uniref:Uncharacterized protein n=1 Tax=Nocardia mangyaensis TaxID=2213200 RepID=A0A1J0VS72_9NOCA|nr:hypothetical protein BOX37_13925 [Nocardia mangyaensis]